MTFSDVKESDWYYDAVQYVRGKGLMKGAGPDIFSPGDETTRGMIVTILYRMEQKSFESAAGLSDVVPCMPEGDEIPDIELCVPDGQEIPDIVPCMPKGEEISDVELCAPKGEETSDVEPCESDGEIFFDVPYGSYYAEAMDWAVLKGIINGYGDGRFGPDEAVTREQMAAILYRYAQYSGFDDLLTRDKEKGVFSDFKDCGQVSAYAAEAMEWAVETGLITGVSEDTLAPKGTAVRAQTAAILMRFCIILSEIREASFSDGNTGSGDNSDIGGFGSGSSSGETSDAGREDETSEKDTILAEYAAKRLRIGYQGGDYAEHVTQDISLPDTIEDMEEEDILITWTSSSDTITSDGTVTRPRGSDETVTLTAEVRSNEAVSSADFQLRVICENGRDPSEIPHRSVIDIENLDPNHKPDITYNEDRSQVISIAGSYSDISVENAEDALDVLQSIRGILGIRDPYSELRTVVINGDEYGREYTFEQRYQGFPVYGRRVTVSAGTDGQTDSLSSGLYLTEKLEQVNCVPEITSEDAELSAVSLYGGTCVAEPDKTSLAWYTLNEYEETPALTWKISVQGNDENGDPVRDTVFIDAESGATANIQTEIMDSASVTGDGLDELGEKVSFPVTFTYRDWYFYYLQDQDRGIQMYKRKLLSDFRTGSEFNRWNDPTSVSAYTNIIRTFDWFKNTLGRDSADNKGTDIKIVTDVDFRTGAFWNGEENAVYFCDDSAEDTGRTPAAALDIAAHEYTHGVVQYVTGGLPYEKAPGAINEGYADIFGCLVQGDWVMGEDHKIVRDATDPEKYRAPGKKNSRYYVNYDVENRDRGGVHINSSLLYHPAYLMDQQGISGKKLAKLWYKSLSMGYDGDSDFNTVRRNVLKAAEKIGLTDREISIIKEIFDQTGIYGDRGTVSGVISDKNGNRISGAEITVMRGDSSTRTLISDEDGEFSVILEEGEYRVNIEAEGYVSRISVHEIEENLTTEINAVLVREGRGAVTGTVVSASSALELAGVKLNIRSGINVKTGEILAEAVTDREGTYCTELDAGYYTIEMICEGYTSGYVNTLVEGGETTTANGSLSAVMDSDRYRVVLTWGAEPQDLDSHLKGKTADGTEFHIYYNSRRAVKEDETEIGCLDVDSIRGFGPETTTFTAETEGCYSFYIKRFSRSGSLADSGAVAEVYNGERLIAKCSVDPSSPKEHTIWKVFKIENGIFTTIDQTSEED